MTAIPRRRAGVVPTKDCRAPPGSPCFAALARLRRTAAPQRPLRQANRQPEMLVSGPKSEWETSSAAELSAILSNPLGGIYWLIPNGDFPRLAVMVADGYADVHYFPEDRAAGFRALGPEPHNFDTMTLFVCPGCDPASGVSTPDAFVLPVEVALKVATDFLVDETRSAAVDWFEL